MASDMIAFDREPRTDGDRRLREAVGLLRPWTSDSGELLRIGGESDGGYVMWSRPDVGWAVSIGSAATCRGTRTWRAGAPGSTFDPTVSKLPSPVPGGTFHRVGISAQPDGDHQPLRVLVEAPRRGAPGPGSSRSTWRATVAVPIDAADGADLAQFAQITMELHDLHQLSDTSAGPRIVRVLRKLWATHLPVHVHANNYARVVKFGAYRFPDTIEASWVRRDFRPMPLPSSASTPRSTAPATAHLRRGPHRDLGCGDAGFRHFDAARRLTSRSSCCSRPGCVALLRRARRPVRHRTVRRPAQAAVPSGLEPVRPGRPARASAHRRPHRCWRPTLTRFLARRLGGVPAPCRPGAPHLLPPALPAGLPGIPKVITIYDPYPGAVQSGRFGRDPHMAKRDYLAAADDHPDQRLCRG